ncbi:MAG: hypothetical protein N2746_00235 [Deltaproteobacteria bacterium]|nr:hypothetical protein [Deltaproteobacteria bacterium]
MDRFVILLMAFTTVFLSLSCSDNAKKPADVSSTDDAGFVDVGVDVSVDDVIEKVESCRPREIKEGMHYQDKFSLSLFHYNIQYIAGGGEKYENAIIKIGFEPILDILLRHPNWVFTIEMQGYMLEIMAERFPKIFSKLKQLVKNCQVEFVSFHYSDQLFLAYPEIDMQWSFDLNRTVFEKYGLFPSGVVFTQEGQFGEGMLKFMKKNNMNIGLYPKNLFKYFQGKLDVAPFYSKYDVDVVVVGAGVNSDNIVVDWSFFNDGELLATGGYSPYFVDTGNYKVDEESIRRYEEELTNKEKEGYKITSIGNYLATVKARGIAPIPLPPLLDGTWQPDDTSNFHRWMGDTKGQVDRDNKVLSSNYDARKYVLSFENLIEFAKIRKIDVSEYEKDLTKVKRLLAYAEVSDSTGWYPKQIEVEYSLSNAKSAKEISIEKIKSLGKKLDMKKTIRIDNYTKEISEIDTPEVYEIRDKCDEQHFKEINSEFYSYEVFCKKVDDFRTDVRVLFTPKNTSASRSATIIFPFELEEIEYVPALMDNEDSDAAIVSYHRSGFARTELNTSLATGLIKIGEDRYLIKHCEYFHISPFINFETKMLSFIDNSPEASGFEWRYSIVRGDKKRALSEMQKINTKPVVYVSSD